MSKPCAQTTLATDNTPLECDEFISTACVVHPDALVELNIPENSTAQDIFNAFLNAIINLNNQLGSTTNVEVVSGVVSGTDIVLTKSDSNTVTIDATALFDDTNLARITSGAIVGTDLVLTRDDASTIIIDVSALGGGGISSVVGGTDITIDNTDPANPIINNSGNFVTLDTVQTITEEKTFDELIRFNNFQRFAIDLPSSIEVGYGNFGLTNNGWFFQRPNTGNYATLDLSLLTDDHTYNLQDGNGTLAFLSDIPTAVQSVVAGTNVTVDNTDPLNPIVSATGGGSTFASVQAGDGIEVDATDADNPIVSGQGLEILSEGGNTGRRLIGSDPADFGDIGDEAIDLSISTSGSSTKGATGNFSFASNLNTTASGAGASSMGNSSIASGNASMAFGNNLFARSANETVVGGYNTDYIPISTNSWSATDKAFVVGTGVGGAQRRDGLTVFKNNVVTAPELTTALIDAEATGRVLITKEWFTANSGGGGISTIVAGTNIVVDNTDPNNPIVSATVPVQASVATITDVPCTANTIDDLLTLSVPANAMADGEVITFECKFTLSALASDQIGLRIDGTFQGVTNVGGSSATSVVMRGFAQRSGSNMIWAGNIVYNGTSSPFAVDYTSTSINYAGGFDFSIAGGGVVGISAGDVTLNNGMIKLN